MTVMFGLKHLERVFIHYSFVGSDVSLMFFSLVIVKCWSSDRLVENVAGCDINVEHRPVLLGPLTQFKDLTCHFSKMRKVAHHYKSQAALDVLKKIFICQTDFNFMLSADPSVFNSCCEPCQQNIHVEASHRDRKQRQNKRLVTWLFVKHFIFI